MARNARGSVAVEAAILLPLLLMIALGGFVVGWLTLRSADLAHAAREGVASVERGDPPGQVQQRVRDTQTSYDPSDVAVTITPWPCDPGDVVAVAVVVDGDRYGLPIPFVGSFGQHSETEARGTCPGAGGSSSEPPPGGGGSGGADPSGLLADVNDVRTSPALAWSSPAETDARACAESMATADTVIACAPLVGAAPTSPVLADAWAWSKPAVVNSGTIGGCYFVLTSSGTGYGACSVS